MGPWEQGMEICLRDHHEAAMVTVCDVKGSVPREVGAKMVVLSDQRAFGTIGGGQLEFEALDEARRCLSVGRCYVKKFQLDASQDQVCGGSVEVLFEPLNTHPDLFVFGGGHVAQALVRILLHGPFRLHIIDERVEYLSQVGFPESVVLHADSWSSFCDSARFDACRTFCVVMTHGHRHDQDIIRALLNKPVRYLGLMGSQKKWDVFRRTMQKEGLDSSVFGRVHCPIGLKLGGKSPTEIGISVAAELLTCLHQRGD